MELVQLRDIVKDFSGVKALVGVSLSAKRGEIHAIVGENGAGKSTLMNILSGTHIAGSFSGDILWEGNSVCFHSPRDASRCGIAIIHQELSVFPHLTVAENMCVGSWPKLFGLLDWSSMAVEAERWLNSIGAKFSVHEKMGDLSPGNQQLVEIAKAISRNSQVLILDEPTSSLTPTEVERLFVVLRGLRADGRALLYISHKMEEIFSLCDRVTVIRDGQSVFTSAVKDVDEPTLISHMVGRSLDRLFPPEPKRPADYLSKTPVLKVRDFSASGADHSREIGPLSFQVFPGEIVGLSGLLGAGRTEIVHALLSGQSSQYRISGELEVKGKNLKIRNPQHALESGIGFVGEDRKRDSIFGVRSLDENVAASRLATGSLRKILKLGAEHELTKGSLSQLNTRYRNIEQSIAELSGGNQQKAVIARQLQLAPDLIILDEPTRGVDVGAKFEIYQILFKLAEAGKALLVISSDLTELMGISDRILVINEGKIAGELDRAEFSQKEIMRLAIQKQVEA